MPGRTNTSGGRSTSSGSRPAVTPIVNTQPAPTSIIGNSNSRPASGVGGTGGSRPVTLPPATNGGGSRPANSATTGANTRADPTPVYMPAIMNGGNGGGGGGSQPNTQTKAPDAPVDAYTSPDYGGGGGGGAAPSQSVGAAPSLDSSGAPSAGGDAGSAPTVPVAGNFPVVPPQPPRSFYAPPTSTPFVQVPEAFLAYLTPSQQMTLDETMQAIGFQPVGQVTRYGESAYITPRGMAAPDLSRITDDNLRSWMRFFLGQYGVGISYNLPENYAGPGVPQAPTNPAGAPLPNVGPGGGQQFIGDAPVPGGTPAPGATGGGLDFIPTGEFGTPYRGR